MSVQSSNLEAIVRQSTWRYDSDGHAIKDKNGNEIAFFNQKRQKSFFGQMEQAFDVTGHSNKELSKLVKELKKKDISAEDMYQLMENYTAFVQNPNDETKFNQLKTFLQELQNKDYTKIEVNDLAASALEGKDKTNHLPQELRLSLSALPENVQEQFRNLTPEQLNMLNELSSDRTFLATLLRDARNTETQFNFVTWVSEHVEETGEGENKTYTFKQKEYVEANDGRTQAPAGQKSLVDQVMDKIHTSSELSTGTKARIKAFLSSTNVPLNLLTTLNTQSRIDIVLDQPAEGTEPNYNVVLDALVTKLEDMRRLSQTGEVNQTELGMKYHDDDEAQNDVARFFDSVLTTPDTLTDLDAQYQRVYGMSLDAMLNQQYGNEFEAQHQDLKTKNPEKYAREKNKYVTKHVQDFKTKFPELQEKFKDVYRNLKEQYDNFDSVISELQTKDPEQFNRLKSKYCPNGTWNKDLLYRDILTKVTGSDATVDRSRRTGFLGLGKSYGEETEHYSRMRFFSEGNDGEIKTSTLKALGFQQDSQIDWGKVAKDAALGSVLGLASMATFGISSQAMTLISEWTNTTSTVRFTKTDTLRDAIYQIDSEGNKVLWSPAETIKGQYQQDGPASLTTEHGSNDPQTSKSTDYGRAAAGVGAVAVLGALHSIVNQLKNNNEVDITNGWNSGFNSNEIKIAVNNAVAEYQASHPGVQLTVADKKEIMADALCKTIFGDGHSVKNYAQKYDLMSTITKFYIDDDLKFDGDAMQADCFSNSSNKLFSPDEAQALIAQLMQRGPSKPTSVRVPLQPEIVNQVVYDINESGLVNAQQGQTVIPESVQSYTQVYSDAWAKDDGVLTRNRQPLDIDAIRTAQTSAGGNITAQAVVSSSVPGQRIVVTPRVNAATGMYDFEKPQKVVVKDTTNDGYIHIFTYEFSKDENGETIYKLSGPVWEIPIASYTQDAEQINGDNFDFGTYEHAVDIRKLKQGTQEYYDEEYRLDLVKTNEVSIPTELDDGRIVNTTVRNYKYTFPQDKNTYAGYNTSSIDYGRYSEHGRRRGR